MHEGGSGTNKTYPAPPGDRTPGSSYLNSDALTSELRPPLIKHVTALVWMRWAPLRLKVYFLFYGFVKLIVNVWKKKADNWIFF